MYYSLKLEVKGTNIKRFLLLLGAKHKNAKREKKKKTLRVLSGMAVGTGNRLEIRLQLTNFRIFSFSLAERHVIISADWS